MPGDPRPIKLEEVFPNNALSQVVCELRFPIVIDLIESQPLSFQKEVRRIFPHYNRNWVLEFEPGAVDATREPLYEFESRDQAWKVSLKPTAISLEASDYKSFDEFEERLSAVLGAATSSLDLLFFTRVGLRYINHFPLSGESQVHQEWVRPQLLAPLQLVELHKVNRFWQEVRGTHETGSTYLLRHGCGISDDIDYTIDIDISLSGVETANAILEIRKFKEIAKRIFLDSISDYALNWLRSEKP